MPEWRDSTSSATTGETTRGPVAGADEDDGAAAHEAGEAGARARAPATRGAGAGDGEADAGAVAAAMLRVERASAPREPAAGDSDAGMSTIREAPRATGSTTQGRTPGFSAAVARAGSQARRSFAPGLRMAVLGAMVVGTCAMVYVVSRMSETTGAEAGPRDGEGRGTDAEGRGAVGVEARGAAGAVGVEARGAAGPGAEAVAGGAASGQAVGAEGGGASGASDVSAAGDGGWRAAEAGPADAPADSQAAAGDASGAGSLWVPVAQADGEAAERRRKIAGQARALMAEPRLLACLLGHVTIGVGRRTSLTGSLVVASGGEVVRASVRAGDGAVPAAARACVAEELGKSRFLPGPQAQLVVPLRLEIQ